MTATCASIDAADRRAALRYPKDAEVTGIEAGGQLAFAVAGGDDGRDTARRDECDLLIGDGLAAPDARGIVERVRE